MDDLEKFQYIALVSKIVTELENHLGISDKVLAEFVISLADEQETPEGFRTSLAKNGAEFSEQLSNNLFKIIKKMRPKNSGQLASTSSNDLSSQNPKNISEQKTEKTVANSSEKYAFYNNTNYNFFLVLNEK
jgi:ATP-dependent RNA helicase DHX8/PRP22